MFLKLTVVRLPAMFDREGEGDQTWLPDVLCKGLFRKRTAEPAIAIFDEIEGAIPARVS
ncbi:MULTISPECIES: hypothetical protein [unclassified Ensifer]|uniref:hypothetical protein n=1 Tax=unclassified Ensifer TaxID=2633371 RepID=UPI00137A7C91|nr:MULTISPECIES: hypothetical protein [unclassified Ensifer]